MESVYIKGILLDAHLGTTIDKAVYDAMRLVSESLITAYIHFNGMLVKIIPNKTSKKEALDDFNRQLHQRAGKQKTPLAYAWENALGKTIVQADPPNFPVNNLRQLFTVEKIVEATLMNYHRNNFTVDNPMPIDMLIEILRILREACGKGDCHEYVRESITTTIKRFEENIGHTNRRK